ncbi:TolC family protein [Rapidithrix thailandica]|uniref:TolC family protein n=1 Tax=Rapidithrix thailandica TaxID=413964 RepID=A0AAW9S9V7_9BACT
MKKQLLMFTLSLWLLSPFRVNAQEETKHFTLKECLQYAVENSVEIRKKAFESRQASQYTKEVRSNGLTQVNAYVNLDINPALPTQLLPGELVQQPGTMIPVQFGTKYNATAGIKAEQLIYDGSFFVGLKAAKASERLYALQEIKTEEDVVLNVAQSYYQLFQLQEQQAVLQSNLDELVKLKKILIAQKEQDLVNEIEVNRVAVSITNINTQLTSLNSNITNQKNYLKLLMGMSVEEPLEIKAPEVSSSSLGSISADTASIQNITGMKLLNMQQELYTLNQKNIRAGYLPTLSAFAQFNYQAQRDQFNFFDTNREWFDMFTIGFRLNIPIFDGMRKRTQVQQNQLDLLKVEEDKRYLSNAIRTDQQNAIAQLQNSMKSVQAQEENIELAFKVYNQTQDLYKEGISPLTDLLNAETSLREAKINLNTELLKYKLAELNLMKAKGELNQLIK